MINFKFARFTLVVYVSHKVNVLVTDINLTIMSQEDLIFTSLHIGSRLFELFGKEVRITKRPGMPLKYIIKGVDMPNMKRKRKRSDSINAMTSDFLS